MRLALGEWCEGAPTALSSSFGYAVSVMHIYSLGLFFSPLEAEFGWKRTEVALGLTIASVIGCIGAPFVGKIVDRIGGRPVAIVGLAFYALGFLLLSAINSIIQFYWIAWGVLAIGAVLISPTIWVSGVVKWFDRSRGLAIAVLLCGGGLCSTLIPAFSSRLISEIGWSGTYIALATISVIAIPVVWLFFDRKNIQTMSPSVVSVSGTSGAKLSANPSAYAEIFSGPYIILTLAAALFYLSLVCLQVHFVQINVEKGIDRSSAATAAGVVGLFAIIGRLTAGALLDRFRTGTVGAAMIFPSLIGAVYLLGSPDGSGVNPFVAGALLGIGLGAEFDVVAYYISRRFKKETFGLLFGTFVGVLTIAIGGGSLLGAVVHDHYGSYDMLKLVVWPCIALTVLVFASLKTPQGRT